MNEGPTKYLSASRLSVALSAEADGDAGTGADDGELQATSAEAMMKVVDPETVDDGTSADANAQLGLALVVAAGVVFAAKPDLFSGH